MKLKYFVYSLLMTMGLMSCSSDDDNETATHNGHWYIYETQAEIDETQADIKQISDAILEGKVLYYDWKNKKEVPVYGNYQDFVGSNGKFEYEWLYYENSDYGRHINDYIRILQIKDDKTILEYECGLYIVDETSKKPLYKWYSGNVFGEVCYAAESEPTVYAYIQIDNMITILSTGDSYFIVDGGLIKEGSNRTLRKFVPASY